MVTKTINNVKDKIKWEINEYEILLEHIDNFEWQGRYLEGKIDGLKLALEYIEEVDGNGKND